MKKFDIKDVFSWSNAEQAKAYINKSGYFADNLDDLQECVNNDNFQTLFSVDLDPKIDVDSVFSITEMDYKFALFIPTDKVTEVEELKKWRLFKTTEEFSEVTGKRIGSILKFKCRGKDECYYTRMYTGFHILANGKIYIELGSEAYNLEQLYNFYEWLNEQGEWQLFGVLE